MNTLRDNGELQTRPAEMLRDSEIHGRRSARGRSDKNKLRLLPRLEPLEGRVLMTTYTVTSTGTANVAGTLLYAINQLNLHGQSSNTINFNISGSGVQTISPTPSTRLPTITKQVTIEGNTSSGVPQIYISGASAGTNANGLTFGSSSNGSIIQDLGITGFASGAGIDISSSSTGDGVVGCWLGINASGSAAANSVGALVAGGSATVGGTATGDANVISGNAVYANGNQSGCGVEIEASDCLVVG